MCVQYIWDFDLCIEYMFVVDIPRVISIQLLEIYRAIVGRVYGPIYRLCDLMCYLDDKKMKSG